MKRFFKKVLPLIVIIVCMIALSCLSVGAVSVAPDSNGYLTITSADRFVLHYCGNERVVYDSPHVFNIWVTVPGSDWKQNENNSGIWLTASWSDAFSGYLTVPNGYTISVIMRSTVVFTYLGGAVNLSKNYFFATLDSNVDTPFSLSSNKITESASGYTKYAEFLWTNNTGKDLNFNSASMGSRDFFNSEGEVSCSFIGIAYRLYSPSEMAAENISSKIDASVDQIKAEMEQQTETIINGWTPSPDLPTGSNNVNDLHNAEQEVLDSSSPGLSLGEGLVNNLGSHLSQFTNGFIFISGMVNTLLGVGFLPGLVQVSLALGIVAFFLNLAPTIFNKIGAKNNKNNSGNKKGGGG